MAPILHWIFQVFTFAGRFLLASVLVLVVAVLLQPYSQLLEDTFHFHGKGFGKNPPSVVACVTLTLSWAGILYCILWVWKD